MLEKQSKKKINRKCSEIARIWMLFASFPWPLVAGKSPLQFLETLGIGIWKVSPKVIQFHKPALKENPDPEG
jgi:hypothetical protein